MAEDHKVTEARLQQSGIPTALLRNGWYTENHTAQVDGWLEHGAIVAAARLDFAQAAAAVLGGDDLEGRVYELAGHHSVSYADVAAIASDAAGQLIRYRDLPQDEYAQMLVGLGLPEADAKVIADSDAGIARGELSTDSADLSRLLGRPSTPVVQTIREAIAERRQSAAAIS